MADQVADTAAAPAESLDFSGKTVAEFRDALAQAVINPLNLVMLTRDRIEEVMSDAVGRGRVTTDDAADLVQGLISLGRKETSDVLSDLERLLGRGKDEMEDRTSSLASARSQVRSRAVKRADPLLQQVDRARRAAGVGPSFPIIGFDELTAASVQGRLDDLSAPELRRCATTRSATPTARACWTPSPPGWAGSEAHRAAARHPPASIGGCPRPRAEPAGPAQAPSLS